MVEQEEIIYESCSSHTSVQEKCEWCKIATMTETMLDKNDLERSEDIKESAEQMAGLMD
jgi:biotin synthase-like enzyme